MWLLSRLTNNSFLKLLSLGLALLLSVYVLPTANPIVTKRVNLPLHSRGLADDLIIVDPIPLPELMQIELQGRLQNVNHISRERPAATCDFSTVGEAGVQAVQVQLPDLGESTILSQSFARVQVRIEEKATVGMPLKIDRQGSVHKDYDIGAENLSQDSVVIVGPKSAVERVVAARLEPAVSGLEHDSSQVLPVMLYDANDRHVEHPALTMHPAEVRYSLTVEPKGSIRVLRVYPDYTGELPEDLLLVELVPKPLSIAAPAELVPEGVFAVTTTAIDLTGARASFTTEARLIYPFEVPEGSRLPATCEVSVRVASVEMVGSGVSVAVELVGKNEDYGYIVTRPEVMVRSDELMMLDEETVQELKARLYVEGLSPGEYRLTPQLSLPLDLDRVKIEPATLQVTIIPSGE